MSTSIARLVISQMFEELVEAIRLEYRSGRYGRYDVDDRPKSHLARLWGGIKKTVNGPLGLATRGKVSLGRHPDSVRGESVESINGLLSELRDALGEGKAQQYHGMMAQHPDAGIRKIASTRAGKESAAGLVSKAKDRKNQLAPQLIRAFRKDIRMGKAVRK